MSKSYNDCLSTRIRHGNATPKEEALADAAPALLEAATKLESIVAAFVEDELSVTTIDEAAGLLVELRAAIRQAEGGGE